MAQTLDKVEIYVGMTRQKAIESLTEALDRAEQSPDTDGSFQWELIGKTRDESEVPVRLIFTNDQMEEHREAQKGQVLVGFQPDLQFSQR